MSNFHFLFRFIPFQTFETPEKYKRTTHIAILQATKKVLASSINTSPIHNCHFMSFLFTPLTCESCHTSLELPLRLDCLLSLLVRGGSAAEVVEGSFALTVVAVPGTGIGGGLYSFGIGISASRPDSGPQYHVQSTCSTSSM